MWRSDATAFQLFYFHIFKGFQLQGDQQRACPSSYGNSPSWSGSTPKCVRFESTTDLQSRNIPMGCLGMRTNEDIIKIQCQPDTIYGQMSCIYHCPIDYRLVGGPKSYGFYHQKAESQI